MANTKQKGLLVAGTVMVFISYYSTTQWQVDLAGEVFLDESFPTLAPSRISLKYSSFLHYSPSVPQILNGAVYAMALSIHCLPIVFT